MITSINTNVSAMIALRNLTTVNTDIEKVQSRVSTGLKVSTAKDDASVFAVAQGIRADISAYEAIGQQLSTAKGLVSVSISATTSISNVMGEMKQKLTQLADPSLNVDQRTIYTNDLRQQIDQIRTFLDRASFNTKNIIGANRGTQGDNFTNWTAPTTLTVIQGVDGSLMNVSKQNLSGGTTGTDGWLALARIVYSVGGGTYDQSSNSAISLSTNTTFTARTAVDEYMARAALADITSATTAYYTSSTATAGTASVFGAAWASFNATVNIALGGLGADNRNVQYQTDFNNSLRDSIKEGLGSLVDADMAVESAMLTALQTKQQLAVQTLSIANQAPNSILSLFRNGG
ncbi:MAG: flagellin [Alphaproteobacteria bacterium]